MVDEVLRRGRLPGFDVPHTSELVRSAVLPPADLVSAAFGFVTDGSRRVLLTHVDAPGRGWDVPGGHLEQGESPLTAAVREIREETGLRLAADDLTPAGWIRIRVEGRDTTDGRYPYPTSYLVYFAARLDVDGSITRPEPGSECSSAEWLTLQEARRRCAHRGWLPLLDAAAMWP